MAATDAPVPTTPPSTYTFGTAWEASNFASLANGGVATKQIASTYGPDADAATPTTPTSQLTVYYGGNNANNTAAPQISGSASSSSSVSWWNKLSNGTKYAIYGGAAGVLVILIALIAFIVVRRRRKRRSVIENRNKAMRMTQRSSFASPMHSRGSASAATLVADQDTYTPNEDTSGKLYTPQQSYNDGYGSKSGMAFNDAQSVHSVPPIYGQFSNGSHVQLQQQQQHQPQSGKSFREDRSQQARHSPYPLSNGYDDSYASVGDDSMNSESHGAYAPSYAQNHQQSYHQPEYQSEYPSTNRYQAYAQDDDLGASQYSTRYQPQHVHSDGGRQYRQY
ncbi:hypothetical protein EMMF5_000010 [Cystobasidiomycetes sp. EMM_F5]